MTEEIRKYIEIAVNSLEDKKCQNLKVMDISEISSLADCFIIASGNNRNQLQAMADELQEKLSACGLHPRAVEGYEKANWILLDYGDIVIHLFDTESRSYYDLDRIWRDALIMNV